MGGIQMSEDVGYDKFFRNMNYSHIIPTPVYSARYFKLCLNIKLYILLKTI